MMLTFLNEFGDFSVAGHILFDSRMRMDNNPFDQIVSEAAVHSPPVENVRFGNISILLLEPRKKQQLLQSSPKLRNVEFLEGSQLLQCLFRKDSLECLEPHAVDLVIDFLFISCFFLNRGDFRVDLSLAFFVPVVRRLGVFCWNCRCGYEINVVEEVLLLDSLPVGYE